MIPRIYDNSFTTYESNGLGLLVDAISCQVEEELNGDFELTLVYPSDGSFFYALKQDNLIKADASDSLKRQLFRIDTISKPLNGQVTVYAKHISFDLAKNSLNEDVNEKNIRCENAGKHMLQKSDADSRFSIKSNIEMLGNYNMDRKTDCLSAIAGTKGSLIDTFGNGPKLLRDNFTISILTRRGKDNNTLIAYKKNITGFTLEEDYTEIINIIKPYATYTVDEVEKTLYLDEIGIKSPRYVEGNIVKSQWIDFSDKFDEDEIPTKEKLKNLVQKYFNDNNCDLPKMTYKIEFQSLSQTNEYKEDGLGELEYIGMDDSVYINNSKYDIRDQAKVIKTTYDVLSEKYISIELGDPKTTLGSIINKSNNDAVTKDEVKNIVKKINKKDYPNTLPPVPVLTIDRAGFKTISLSWEYENKPYYSYEVYASQEQGFTPNVFDLIFKGQASAFLHEVECSQTWYYKVRAVNTYGSSTEFSKEVSAKTTKISDATEYFQEAAIESALIGSLNADVINAGKLKGTFIDAKQLTVTDGNGNTTLAIDSAGNVSIRATEFVLEEKTIGEIVIEKTKTTVKSVNIYYYLSTSLTELIGGTWQNKAPVWERDKYMWQKTITTYNNDTTVESTPVCIAGAKGEDGTSVTIKGSFTSTDELTSVTNPQAGDGYLVNGDLWVYDGSTFKNVGQIKGDKGEKGDSGVSVTSISERFGISDSKDIEPTTWYSSFPEWSEGKYIWTKTRITYSDGSVEYTTPYVDTSWEQIMDNVNNKVDNSQEAIFNTLTNDGKTQGIYLSNGKIYINGEYIKTNSLVASKITFDDLTGKTIKGARFFTAPNTDATDGYLFRIYSDGRVYSSNLVQVYGEKDDGVYSQMTPGIVSATKYMQSPGFITSNNTLYFGIQGYEPPNDNTTRMVKLSRDSDDKYSYFMPCYNPTSTSGGIRLGSTSGFWNAVYATNGVKTSSDRTLKEDINYLNKTASIDYDDLYNFIKNDYMLATYNYIGENEKRLSAIAQDILVNSDGTDNKIGQLITNSEEAYKNQSTLAIEETQLVNVLIGALKKTIEKVEVLERKINNLGGE